MREERTLASQRLFEGRVVSLRLDQVQLPDGRTAQREIVEHRASVVLVPLDGEGNVLMVRQYRLPAAAALLELPAGGVDAGEDPHAAAMRELQEETGYRPGKLERLGGFFSAPGFCTEYLHLFLASELQPNPRPPDADEVVELVRIPLSQVAQLITTGELQDAKSIAGLLWVLLYHRASALLQ